MEGGLELLSYHAEESINCVKFGSTYYGTDKTEMATLYNNGPEPVCFVSILDEEAIGQEVVRKINKLTFNNTNILNNKMLDVAVCFYRSFI